MTIVYYLHSTQLEILAEYRHLKMKKVSAVLLRISFCWALSLVSTNDAFSLKPLLKTAIARSASNAGEIDLKLVKVGDLLSDLPTPSLLLELSLAEGSVESHSLDDVLRKPRLVDDQSALEGCLFVHTTVTDTSERDKVDQEYGSGKSSIIAQVDATLDDIPGGAYLGIGLANHHVGGYYWARGMGMGASLPAHGIAFGDSSLKGSGKLFWRKRGPGLDATETTEESSNSNDGKRSEWADFVTVGDTVQLIPESTSEALEKAPFNILLGVRRIGRPLGADPIVERIWVRSNESDEVWVPES